VERSPPRGLIVPAGPILIECKNWSVAVGTAEVVYFDRKLEDRGLTLGILVALNGITGDSATRTAAHSIIAGALRAKRQMIVLSRREIEAIVHSDQLVRLIKEKLCDLAVSGTVFT
jgi:hypothetical protein